MVLMSAEGSGLCKVWRFVDGSAPPSVRDWMHMQEIKLPGRHVKAIYVCAMGGDMHRAVMEGAEARASESLATGSHRAVSIVILTESGIEVRSWPLECWPISYDHEESPEIKPVQMKAALVTHPSGGTVITVSDDDFSASAPVEPESRWPHDIISIHKDQTTPGSTGSAADLSDASATTSGHHTPDLGSDHHRTPEQDENGWSTTTQELLRDTPVKDAHQKIKTEQKFRKNALFRSWQAGKSTPRLCGVSGTSDEANLSLSGEASLKDASREIFMSKDESGEEWSPPSTGGLQENSQSGRCRSKSKRLEARAEELGHRVRDMEKELGGIHDAFTAFSNETRRNLSMLTSLVDQLVAAQELAAAQRRGEIAVHTDANGVANGATSTTLTMEP